MIVDYELLRTAVNACVDNLGPKKAAETLGISRSTLWRITDGEGVESLSLSSLNSIAAGLNVSSSAFVIGMERSDMSLDDLLTAVAVALLDEGLHENRVRSFVKHIESAILLLGIKGDDWPGVIWEGM